MFVFGRLIAVLVTAATAVGAVAILLMMLQIVADVLLKNILSWPLPLTSIFVAHYYLVIAAFLPLALAEKLSRHISVELVFQHLGAAWKRWIGTVVCLFAGVVVAGLAWELWVEAGKKARAATFIVEQSISMPTWPSYYVLPVGFGLMALVLLYRSLVMITGLASGLGEAPLEDTDQADQA